MKGVWGCWAAESPELGFSNEEREGRPLARQRVGSKVRELKYPWWVLGFWFVIGWGCFCTSQGTLLSVLLSLGGCGGWFVLSSTTEEAGKRATLRGLGEWQSFKDLVAWPWSTGIPVKKWSKGLFPSSRLPAPLVFPSLCLVPQFARHYIKCFIRASAFRYEDWGLWSEST